MTPELRALLQNLVDNLVTLAEAVSTLAGNTGHEQMERKARLVASELADANLTLEEV